MTDNVNNPSHYQFSNGSQVIDITENLNFNRGNVVKYVARAGRKSRDPLEDLRKARFYLDREIALLSSQYNPFQALLDAEDAELDDMPEGLSAKQGVIWVDNNGGLWRLDGDVWTYFDGDAEKWYTVIGTPSHIYEPFEETDLWLNA